MQQLWNTYSYMWCCIAIQGKYQNFSRCYSQQYRIMVFLFILAKTSHSLSSHPKKLIWLAYISKYYSPFHPMIDTLSDPIFLTNHANSSSEPNIKTHSPKPSSKPIAQIYSIFISFSQLSQEEHPIISKSTSLLFANTQHSQPTNQAVINTTPITRNDIC